MEGVLTLQTGGGMAVFELRPFNGEEACRRWKVTLSCTSIMTTHSQHVVPSYYILVMVIYLDFNISICLLPFEGSKAICLLPLRQV